MPHPAATVIPGPRTCGTCGYANDEESGLLSQTVCTNAASWHAHRLMPKIEGCTQWYPKEPPNA